MIQKLLRTIGNVLGVKILSGDTKHPDRPDVFILRHFTWDEAHAFQIGFYLVGAIMLLYTVGGEPAVLGALALGKSIWGKYKSNRDSLPGELAGAISQVWYLGFGGLMAYLIVGVPLGVIPPEEAVRLASNYIPV